MSKRKSVIQKSPSQKLPSANSSLVSRLSSLKMWWGWAAAILAFALYANTLSHSYCLDDFSVMIAWNEGRSSETRPITVPDGGVAELDFTLR